MQLVVETSPMQITFKIINTVYVYFCYFIMLTDCIIGLHTEFHNIFYMINFFKLNTQDHHLLLASTNLDLPMYDGPAFQYTMLVIGNVHLSQFHVH